MFNFVYNDGIQYRVTGVATRLRTGRFAIRFPVEAIDFSVLRNFQTPSGPAQTPV